MAERPHDRPSATAHAFARTDRSPLGVSGGGRSTAGCWARSAALIVPRRGAVLRRQPGRGGAHRTSTTPSTSPCASACSPCVGAGDPARRRRCCRRAACGAPPSSSSRRHRRHDRRCRSSATRPRARTRWIDLGGFTLQPSEFIKPALIVLVAWMFAEGQKGRACPASPSPSASTPLTVGLLLIQPDIGQTVLITIAFGAVLLHGRRAAPLGHRRWARRPPRAWSSTYFLFDHVASRVQTGSSRPTSADTHQIDRASEAIARRRPVRARAGRGRDEAPRARPAHRLHLFGRRPRSSAWSSRCC